MRIGDSMTWTVDAHDKLIGWNDAWAAFAAANGDAGLPGRVANTSLFDHITGAEAKELHRRLLAAARSGRRIELTFSCDSPEERRLFSLRMTAGTDGAVHFESGILLITPERTRPSTLPLIRLCGWCGRIEDDGWQLPESVVKRRGLLALGAPPRITHAICPDCYSRISAEFGIPET